MASREQIIKQYYREQLGTEADAPGLQYWLGRTDLDDEALRIGIQQAGREQLLRKLYKENLGASSIDAEGLKYWMGRTDLNAEQLKAQIIGAGKPQVAAGAAAGNRDVLMTDAAYAEFLRNMNFNESQIQSNLQAAQEAAARKISGAQWGYDQQRKQGQQNINRDFQQRQNRSGERLVKINDQKNQVDNAQLQFETGINESKAAMERQAAQAIATGRREHAEQELQARRRLTEKSVGA